VTAAPIGSPFLTPQSLCAFFAERLQDFLPDIRSNAFFAISTASPDFPTPMLRTTFSSFISFIMF
jgi:hypothetical protein